MKKEIKSVKLEKIQIKGTQTRVSIDKETVKKYAAEMKGDDQTPAAVFPPIVLFFDGTEYHLGDGFHRYLASEKCEFKDIQAEVRPGTADDALTYSLGANSTHGLPRTNEDKRNCAVIALKHHPDLSDRLIADMTKLSNTYIGKVRKEIEPPPAPIEKKTENVDSPDFKFGEEIPAPSPAKRKGKDGKTREVKPKKTVKEKAAAYEKPAKPEKETPAKSAPETKLSKEDEKLANSISTLRDEMKCCQEGMAQMFNTPDAEFITDAMREQLQDVAKHAVATARAMNKFAQR